MIQKFEVSGVHLDIEPKLKAYISKKLQHLDYYIPRAARPSVHAEVILKVAKTKDNNRNICEVIVHLPHETIAAKEATVNMFAAVDIVEAKLKNRLRKYKELHAQPRIHRRILARLTRRNTAPPASDR